MKTAAGLSLLFAFACVSLDAAPACAQAPAQMTMPARTRPGDISLSAIDPTDLDPSPQPQLGLESIIEQERFARNQFYRGFFEGEYIKQSFQRIFHKRYRKVLKQHPEWFELLRQHEGRYVPSAESGPAIINSQAEFKNISTVDYGYCWGFATLIRNFAVLAFFDPDANPLDGRGNEIDRQARKEDWLSFYRRKIDDVALYGKATVIPGFANLRELSLVPELELYLKIKTMQLWRSLAIRGAGLGFLLRTRLNQAPAETGALVKDLEARLARHEMPKLLISSEARTKGLVHVSKAMHVVLAYAVAREPDGGARIRIWDVNYYAESLQKSPKEIVVGADGSMSYEPWRTPSGRDAAWLARVEVAPESNFETVDHLYELKRFCSNSETARYCKL